jgi:hypothetical protein
MLLERPCPFQSFSPISPLCTENRFGARNWSMSQKNVFGINNDSTGRWNRFLKKKTSDFFKILKIDHFLKENGFL